MSVKTDKKHMHASLIEVVCDATSTITIPGYSKSKTTVSDDKLLPRRRFRN